jgi:hypothetical protein
MLNMKPIRIFIYYWSGRGIPPDQIKADLHAHDFNLHAVQKQYAEKPTLQMANAQQTGVIRARLLTNAQRSDASLDLLDAVWQ